MFNPFKKKENEFKLDDMELPSLNDGIGPNDNLSSETKPIDSNLPLNQDIGATNSTNSSQNSLGQLDNSFSNLSSSTSSTQDFSMPIGSSNNSFDIGNSQMQSPMQNNNNNFNNSPSNSNLNNVNNGITRAKLDSMEAKVTLIDARLSSIEQKLELISRLILEEVSDTTKRKINVSNMMDSVRNK